MLTKSQYERLKSKPVGDLTQQELTEVLEFKAAKAKAGPPPPQPPEDMDPQPLLNYISSVVKSVEENGYPGDDLDQCVLEELIDFVYGSNSCKFWEWWHKNATF